MTPRRLPPFIGFLALAALPAAALGQGADEGPKPFERRYIDASRWKGDQVLLHDWPELTDLVVWSRGLEAAVAESDRGLSEELMVEFRSRAERLRRDTLPAFLAGRADSVRGALAAIDATLKRAEAALVAVPEAEVVPKEGAAQGGPERQRTLVTGNTAVTVPSGVAVGSERDSLPAVGFRAGESVNFVDLVALALVELDRVVHLTRRAGAQAGSGSEATPPRSGRGPTRGRSTPPRPAAP